MSKGRYDSLMCENLQMGKRPCRWRNINNHLSGKIQQNSPHSTETEGECEAFQTSQLDCVCVLLKGGGITGQQALREMQLEFLLIILNGLDPHSKVATPSLSC